MDVSHEDEPPKTSPTRSAALEAWAKIDAERAVHPADRRAIASTEAARSLVLELSGTAAPTRDLFSACARLGSLMGEEGASPTLVAGTIDGAALALSEVGMSYDAGLLASSQAAVIEGYVAAIRDSERAHALGAWEYPACVVPLDDVSVAIACGYPSTDREELGAWAARIAGHLSKARIRRVVLAGKSEARAELASAFALVGIDVDSPERASDREPSGHSRGWLRFLWRK